MFHFLYLGKLGIKDVALKQEMVQLWEGEFSHLTWSFEVIERSMKNISE